MDVNKAAPVVAASEIEVAAPPDAVWDVLTDFDRWPTWNPDVKSMSFDGDVAEGSKFRWRSGPGRIVSTIRRVERPRLIGWTGKTFGASAVHVYRLEGRDGHTLVKTEESFEGPVARLARRPMQRMLEKALEKGLSHLKARVEQPESRSAR
jgi:uncharacterized protein YndB with AHSA1/START domain